MSPVIRNQARGREEDRMEMDVMKALRREERITLSLRALYEQYGFRKYRMGRFEEYELLPGEQEFWRK